MLEISYSRYESYLEICLFPKSVHFIKSQTFSQTDSFLKTISSIEMGNSKVKYDFFDISKAKISYRLRCANYIGYNSENIFDYRLKIGESLNFLSSFYKKESLSNVALRHFNLKRELLQVYPNQALKEDLFLLSLTPLFLKDSRVWCVFIKDENLSHENIKALEGLFLSKIENTKAIILYSTESGKSLNFEFENELMLFKKD